VPSLTKALGASWPSGNMPSAFWSSTAWQSARQGIPEHIVVANNLREGLGVGRASWLSRSVQYLWIPCLDLSFGWDADVILLVHVDALFSSLLRASTSRHVVNVKPSSESFSAKASVAMATAEAAVASSSITPRLSTAGIRERLSPRRTESWDFEGSRP